jgi:hypothetical protein
VNPAPVIRVTVEGGLVQAVDGIPPGVVVEVWDFDQTEDADCEQNEEGDTFRRITWGRPCEWCSGSGVDPVGMPGEPCPLCGGAK